MHQDLQVLLSGGRREGASATIQHLSPPLLLLIQCVTWRILLRESDVRVKFARGVFKKIFSSHLFVIVKIKLPISTSVTVAVQNITFFASQT